MKILNYKYAYLIFSLLIIVPGVFSLVKYGLNLSIDFTGGSSFEYQLMGSGSKQQELKDIFSSNQVDVESVVLSGHDRVLIRTKPVDASRADEVQASILTAFPEAKRLSFETVGPSIGDETSKRALLAVAVASVGILLYIAYSFRNIPKPYSSYKFGVCAVVAMLHDAFVVLGIFSILGHFLKMEVDSLFITAVLTIIGFSVHDTIVVFDRIRENLKKLPQAYSFTEVADYSLIETLNRSLATSFTVLLTLAALFLLGGESIKVFVLTLLIGITSGTYSSIFNAVPLLVIWEEKTKRQAR